MLSAITLCFVLREDNDVGSDCFQIASLNTLDRRALAKTLWRAEAQLRTLRAKAQLRTLRAEAQLRTLRAEAQLQTWSLVIGQRTNDK